MNSPVSMHVRGQGWHQGQHHSWREKLPWASVSSSVKWEGWACVLSQVWLSPLRCLISCFSPWLLSTGSLFFLLALLFLEKAVRSLSSSEVAPWSFCHKDRHTKRAAGGLLRRRKGKRARGQVSVPGCGPSHAFREATTARLSLPLLGCSRWVGGGFYTSQKNNTGTFH